MSVANVRNIHRAMRTLTRRDHGRERGHHPPARPAPHELRCQRERPSTRSRRPPHIRQPSRRPSRGRSRCHPYPILGRHLASARTTEEQLPTAPCMCHLGLRWSTHPNPTWHIWMPSSGSCAASEPAIHEVAPSGAPASPATCACRTRPRHSATARSNDTNLYNAPTATGRVASHPHTTVWPPAPPLSPHRRPGTARAEACPPTHMSPSVDRSRRFGGGASPVPTQYRYNA